MRVGPQPGFQERFLQSSADIVIGGGAAGCGKSWASLAEPLRWVRIPGFTAVFFRRSTVQVRNPGGLLDESRLLYPSMGGTLQMQGLEWVWPTGARIKMAHLEHEDTVRDWQGAQVCLFIFDELTHFTEQMFFYMLSRNRSMCGVRPYIRATCNPDADSWVAKFIEWWIDQDTGYPIPERAGVVRYFARRGEKVIWRDSREEVMDTIPGINAASVKSMTFIPGKLDDNRILNEIDPAYRGNLMMLSRVERGRLLDGNWKIKAAAGMYFQRHEAVMIDAPPLDVNNWVRRWDLAATEVTDTSKDPDWTVGVKIGKTSSGRLVVADVIMKRVRANAVRELIAATAKQDGHGVRIGVPQDPGQAGKEQAESYKRDLQGYQVWSDRETGDKVTRADTFASHWQRGNVSVVRAAWNDQYLAQLEAFPSDGVHDDAVDASSGAFSKLMAPTTAPFVRTSGLYKPRR